MAQVAGRKVRADPRPGSDVHRVRRAGEGAASRRATRTGPSTICQSGLDHHPDSVVGRVLWGKALINLGRPAEAMEQFDQRRQHRQGEPPRLQPDRRGAAAQGALPLGAAASAQGRRRCSPTTAGSRQWLEQTQRALAGGPAPSIADFTARPAPVDPSPAPSRRLPSPGRPTSRRPSPRASPGLRPPTGSRQAPLRHAAAAGADPSTRWSRPEPASDRGAACSPPRSTPVGPVLGLAGGERPGRAAPRARRRPRCRRAATPAGPSGRLDAPAKTRPVTEAAPSFPRGASRRRVAREIRAGSSTTSPPRPRRAAEWSAARAAAPPPPRPTTGPARATSPTLSSPPRRSRCPRSSSLPGRRGASPRSTSASCATSSPPPRRRRPSSQRHGLKLARRRWWGRGARRPALAGVLLSTRPKHRGQDARRPRSPEAKRAVSLGHRGVVPRRPGGPQARHRDGRRLDRGLGAHRRTPTRCSSPSTARTSEDRTRAEEALGHAGVEQLGARAGARRPTTTSPTASAPRRAPSPGARLGRGRVRAEGAGRAAAARRRAT